MDLPVGTVKDWLAGRVPKHAKRVVDGRLPEPTCRRCGHPVHTAWTLPPRYAYLLGLYLGDGSISSYARGVYRLRITLDTRYPGIIASAAQSVGELRGVSASVFKRRNQNCVDVSSYWKSWPCLLPQHAAGRKHEREIALTYWQQALVDRWPDQLIRGLIHSDGCRFINTGRGNWRCPRYTFSQASADIRRIFCDACEQLGLHWTRAGERTIYVSRKADVAILDGFIGPKR